MQYFSKDPKYQGKYLLSKQKIEGNKNIHEDELRTYIKQKSNRNILGIYLYVGFYYTGKIAHDTAALQKMYNKKEAKYDERIKAAKKEKKKAKLTKAKEKALHKIYREITEGNWIMRTMGEEPVVFDSIIANLSATNLSKHLKSRGYFRNEVSWSVKYKRKKAKATYHIKQYDPYIVENIYYNIPNTRIDSIYKSDLSMSLLSKGSIYNESKLSDERDRFFNVLKNNGYYAFTKQHIYYTLDSTRNKNALDLTFNIDTDDKSELGIYTVEEADFYSEVSKGTSMPTHFPIKKNGFISYQLYGKKYNTKILNNKIFLKKGEIYNQRKTENIQRRLGTLDMFKLVNIRTEVTQLSTNDSLSNQLKIFIYTSPLKKHQLTQEYGLTVGQGFIPGPFFNVSYKARNIFKNFEIFNATVMYSIVGQQSAIDVDKVITTQDFLASVSLTFPTLIFPGGLRKKVERSAPRSRLLTSYGYTDRFEYKRDYINTSLSYFFLGKNKFSQFGFSPIDMYVIISKIKTDDFQAYLNTLRTKGNNLYLTFRPSIVTNFNMWYSYNNFQFGTNEPSVFFKPYFEIGGNVPNLVNKHITKDDNGKLFGLQYYEYFKLQVDLRHTRPITKKHSISAKLISGLSKPYGSSSYNNNGSYVLPYEKYFFSGGTNSIRAWQSRRLGPGSYRDSTNGYLYEQPGEILIETSIEYRFKIYRFLEGALFADAGNVWRLKDPTRPGSEFQYFNSIKDFGVGVGYGIRFNFTFLIVRFDMGYKFYDPAQPLARRYVFYETIKKNPAFNIGIGYPF